MARRRRKSSKLSADPVIVQIESLSHDGRGIAHVDDKVVFIDGALAGEKISFITFLENSFTFLLVNMN